MKHRMLTLAAIAIAFPLFAFAAGAGHEHHDKAASQKLELNAGKKWATDDALRKGMNSMRGAIVAALPAAHSGKATSADYDALAKTLGAQVESIVQNCKLDPKADAQLHLVLEQIIGGIDAVEGKNRDKKRAHGVVQVAQALNVYGKHFDHAGWQPISMPH